MGADSRTTTGGGGRMRNLLVTGEVATAVLLLFGAGLLLRTLIAVESFDRGYRAESVLTMVVDPLGSSYPDPRETAAVLRPGRGRSAVGSRRPGRGVVERAAPGRLALRRVSLYLRDRGRRATRRGATAHDQLSAGEPGVFLDARSPHSRGPRLRRPRYPREPARRIVNEAFARSLGGRSPIGMRVSFKPADSQSAPAMAEIVGVAKQVKQRPDETADFVQMYVPMVQDPSDDMILMVRSRTGNAEDLTSSVRSAISRIDREQLVSVAGVVTLEDVAWASTGRHRFRAVMVTAFATLAVVLAMVGVFGILAYSVQLRVRDFGVRRALGASTGDVLRLVVGSATRVIAIGAAIGLLLSAMLGRLLTSVLFGVQPLDLPTFAAVTVVLGLTAAISIAAPAWRAAKIDPAITLRAQ